MAGSKTRLRMKPEIIWGIGFIAGILLILFPFCKPFFGPGLVFTSPDQSVCSLYKGMVQLIGFILLVFSVIFFVSKRRK